MAKRKAVAKKTVAKPRAPRKKAPQATTTVVQTHTQVTPPPFQYQQPVPMPGDYGPPPYPVPGTIDSTQTTTTSTGPVGGDLSDMTQTFNDAKSLYKSKNFWGAISMFGLSALTVMGSIPAVANNPTIMGIAGMGFAVLWIVFRFMTNQPVTPAINMPHPNEWFKKKDAN